MNANASGGIIHILSILKYCFYFSVCILKIYFKSLVRTQIILNCLQVVTQLQNNRILTSFCRS